MEERVAALEDQLSSTVSPRPCPLTLQQTAKVYNFFWNTQIMTKIGVRSLTDWNIQNIRLHASLILMDVVILLDVIP